VNVVVTGSRDWPFEDKQPITDLLDGLYWNATVGHLTVELAEFHLYAGENPNGGDKIAKWWAENSPTHSYNESPDDPLFEYHGWKAEWGRWGRAAGPIRNARMLADAGSGVVVAFHSSRLAFENEGSGTNHCARLGERMGTFQVYDIIRNPRS
jgi:hypothetical protein